MMVCSGECTSLLNDSENCGSCGTACTNGTLCGNGQCVRVCANGLLACGADCIDPATDETHCGECNNTCGAALECRGGDCSCPSGQSECSGVCVDTQIDQNHCGICNRSCGMERTCDNGSCSCATGESTCSAECVDLMTSSVHCGECDRACAADQICAAGECVCGSGTRESLCTDGLDDDCDQLIDCEDSDCDGRTRECSGICGPGVETCSSGVWGVCEGGNGSMEICGDGIDQDCDGFDIRIPDQWEPNDDCDHCPLITNDVNPNVFLNARHDYVNDNVDCFSFDVNDAFGPLRESLTIILSEIPAGHDYDLYLYRDQAACAASNVLASSAQFGNATETIEHLENLGGDDEGRYYVRVVRWAGHSCTQDYRLSVRGFF